MSVTARTVSAPAVETGSETSRPARRCASLLPKSISGAGSSPAAMTTLLRRTHGPDSRWARRIVQPADRESSREPARHAVFRHRKARPVDDPGDHRARYRRAAFARVLHRTHSYSEPPAPGLPRFPGPNTVATA